MANNKLHSIDNRSIGTIVFALHNQLVQGTILDYIVTTGNNSNRWCIIYYRMSVYHLNMHTKAIDKCIPLW